MTGLLTALSGALSPLWEMSLTAAYAAAIVALLRLVLKKRAPRQVLCLLWLVVFARLLIPVPLESPLSIVPDAERVEQVQELPSKLMGGGQAAPAQGHGPENPLQGQSGGVTAAPVSQGNTNPGINPALTVPNGTAPAEPLPEAPAGIPWQAVIAGVWLAGALAMGGYGLISYLRLRRRLYDAIRAQDGAWEHPAVGSPFILGVFRPRIYLPAGLSGQPRQFILCHERAHLRRLDHIVKPVCWAALALHWFNPLVWMAFILMSRDIEAACDEAVIRRLGPQVKADYSATLLSLATGGRVPAPCPLAFDEGNAKGRIKNVLNYRRPALWIVVVSVIAAALAAVCLLTDPVSAEAPEDPNAGPSPEVSEPPEASQPAGEGLNDLLDPWMLEVLNGERTFSNSQDEFNIHQLRTMVYGDEFPDLTIEVGKLALIDLDRDGINEMVVWPADTSGERDDPVEFIYTLGYLTFRRQGDAVRVYYAGWRPMQNLKADGTFNWSSSAWNSGISRLTNIDTFESEDITWCDTPNAEDNYFVDGLKATRAEFEAAYAAQQAKPEPDWYVFEGGQLWPAPLEAPFRPDSLVSDPGPRALTQEELDYFEQYFAMGDGQVPNIRSMLLVSEYSAPRDIDLYRLFYHGLDYVPDISQAEYDALGWGQEGRKVKVTAAKMDRILQTYLGIPLEETNEVGLDDFQYLPEYDAYYTSHNDTEADVFDMKLGVLNEDGTIDLVYQSTLQGGGLRMATLAESQLYTYRLYYQVRSNIPVDYQDPFAAAEPSPEPSASPEPSPAPEQSLTPAAPTVCEHGLDYAAYDFSNGYLTIRCELDDVRYPLPAATAADNWEAGFMEDFDGDGRIEHAFSCYDGTLLVADVEDGQLRTYVFDPTYLASGFNDTVTYQFVDEYQALDFTYQGYGMRVDLSQQWSAMMNHGRSYYPCANASQTAYAFTREWAGGAFDMAMPVWLENGFGGPICYLSWGLRYTGSGFQLLSGSFGYRMPQ